MEFNGRLNAYSLVPSTVPPFKLEEEFRRCKTRPGKAGDDDLIYEQKEQFKDPFLHSNLAQWAPLVENVGCNAVHEDERRANVSKDSSDSSQDSYNEEKVEGNTGHGDRDSDLESQNILQDIGGEWGGAERLKALYSEPAMRDYNFKNEKDRKEWAEYIAKVKRFYYDSNYNSGNGTTDRNQGELESIKGKMNSDQPHSMAWLEDLNREKERWKRLRRSKYQKWKPHLKRLLLDSHYVPLAFRLFIVILCSISLGIACRIFLNSRRTIPTFDGPVRQQASTIMAICVNSLAIVYSVMIAYDEFSGKPLGLRNPLGKLRLILVDLLFIIFASANLALAFNTLFDPKWVCKDDLGYVDRYPRVGYICRKQRALSSFLFIMMFTWVLTFALTIARVVDRVSTREPRF